MDNLSRSILENCAVAIAVFDNAGHMIFANRIAIDELAKAGLFDVTGAHVDQLSHSSCPHRCWIAKPEAGRDAPMIHNDVDLPDGQRISATSGSIEGDDGVICGFVCSKSPVDDREQDLAQKLEIYQAVIDATDSYVFAKNTQGEFLVANAMTVNVMKAHRPEKLIGKTDFDFYPHDLASQYRKDEVEFFSHGNPVSIEQPILDASGNRGVMLSAKYPLKDSAGKLAGYIGHGRNITKQRSAEHLVKERETELEHAQLMAQLGSWSLVLGSDMFRYSSGLRSMFELPTKSDLTLKQLLHRVSAKTRRLLIRQARKALSGQYAREFHFEHIDKNVGGKLRVFRCLMVASRTFSEQRLLRGFCQDVTQQVDVERKLTELAYNDPLTKLYNRAGFSRQLDAMRENQPDIRFDILLIDLDGFKNVNDTLGHNAGDETLIEVARRLRTAAGSAGIVARLGGDEFVIAIPSTLGDTTEYAAKACVRLMRAPVTVGTSSVSIGASVGIAESVDDDESLSEQMSRADTALYRTKQEGRDGYRFGNETSAAAPERRVEITAQLRKAIDRGEICNHYQPLFETETGQYVGMECLARWMKQDGSMVPPGQFIPVAERSSLIAQLGRNVLRQACARMASWKNQPWSPEYATVNVSPMQFWHADMVEEIACALEDYGLSGCKLKIEITESVFLDHRQEQILECLRDIKSLGVELCLDDFGAGYSSLGYLEKLPFSVLKIDRSLVQDIATSKPKMSIFKGIIGIAHDIDMSVVAEGIENAEDLQAIRDAGCDLAQGYYLARPKSAIDTETFLQSKWAAPKATTKQN